LRKQSAAVVGFASKAALCLFEFINGNAAMTDKYKDKLFALSTNGELLSVNFDIAETLREAVANGTTPCDAEAMFACVIVGVRDRVVSTSAQAAVIKARIANLRETTEVDADTDHIVRTLVEAAMCTADRRALRRMAEYLNARDASYGQKTRSLDHSMAVLESWQRATLRDVERRDAYLRRGA
jgi:hypothetical protein